MVTSPTSASASPTVSGGDTPRRPALHWWREVAIAGGLYLLYSLVRNVFGAGPESRLIAFRHARSVIRAQDTLGLWFEPELQEWYLSLPANGFIRGWNIFYGTAHFVVTIAVLVLAFTKAPQIYRFVRTMLAGATGLALIGFATYTLMPPRLLDASSPFGACAGLPEDCYGYGIVDTIEIWGGLWRFGDGGMAAVSNQYAAMPSLHFAWSTWCAITFVMVVGRGRGRWWAFSYPAITLFCILVTGNHFWIDAFFGGVVLTGGWLIAMLADRLSGRWPRRGRPRRGVETALCGSA
ncbi:phosphatase PAP2 family protein [soil metagenome]